jgi:general secretion pathway protein C
LNTQWLDSTGDKLGRAWQFVGMRLQYLAEPRQARRLKYALYGLAGLYLLLALAQLTWSLLPQSQAPAGGMAIINPITGAGQRQDRPTVNIVELTGWNLFGTAASKPLVAAKPLTTKPQPDSGDLAGIENSAKETRLKLKLQGIVASSDASAARAIIENQRKQVQYGIGDKLPVSGKVTVAKILSDRVVLDNGGKYELLILFDKSSLSSQPLRSVAPARQPTVELDRRSDKNVTEMAEAYRKRLYTNPQSLSEVVKIAAVREGGELRGYRVSAGKDREQFKNLGFEANDIVTGVNGIELTDPGKAMELYRVMRSAEEASFNVLRGDQEVTLVVGLQSPADSE